MKTFLVFLPFVLVLMACSHGSKKEVSQSDVKVLQRSLTIEFIKDKNAKTMEVINTKLAPLFESNEVRGFHYLIEPPAKTLAHVAGFKAGDIILSANNKPIRTPSELNEMFDLFSVDGRFVILLERDGKPLHWEFEVKSY